MTPYLTPTSLTLWLPSSSHYTKAREDPMRDTVIREPIQEADALPSVAYDLIRQPDPGPDRWLYDFVDPSGCVVGGGFCTAADIQSATASALCVAGVRSVANVRRSARRL